MISEIITAVQRSNPMEEDGYKHKIIKGVEISTPSKYIEKEIKRDEKKNSKHDVINNISGSDGM